MTPSVLLRNNVKVLGTGTRWLVLAHGFGSDQTAWSHHADALRDDHRVLLYDNVGAGHSDVSAYSPRRYRSMHGYATDLLEILDAVGASDVRFVGHSMSGMVGVLAARAQPERFHKLVLVGASPRYLNDEGYFGGFEPRDVDELIAAMSGNYHAWVSGFSTIVAENPERPEIAAQFASTLAQLRPDIAVAVSRMVYESDHRADLPGLSVPTLVLQSTHDIAVPLSVGKYLEQHIPDARLHVVDAQGHLPHLSNPAGVLAAMRPLLG
jgi:sigma-B regulation protein RsbQ